MAGWGRWVVRHLEKIYLRGNDQPPAQRLCSQASPGTAEKPRKAKTWNAHQKPNDSIMLASSQKPIFIFSSSWRSGSTLLQRFVTASGEALIWGETGGALCAISEAIADWEQITASSSRHFPSGLGGAGEAAYRQLTSSPKDQHALQWIANLSPPYAEILDQLRSMFLALYHDRAMELGYSRFGFKETRCGLESAQRLLRVFPDARFIFLVRNPLDVILSIKRRNWMEKPANHATLKFFAMHWLRNSRQFRNADFGLYLRYEDFVANASLRSQVLDYLDIGSAPAADFIQSSHVDWMTSDTSELSMFERVKLKYWLSDEMKAQGYL